MLLSFTVATALLAGSWLLLRHQAGGGRLAWVGLDAGPILLGWSLLLALTARPVLAAVAITAASAGLALADAAKRATLKEPLVFADRAELLEVVRHPGLYLPFAGPLRVLGGTLVAILAVAALVWFEPPAPHPSPIGPALILATCLLLPVRPAILPRLAAAYRARGVSGDPVADMRRFGFLATLILHATVARAERPGRRAAIPAFPPAAGPPRAGPLVLVQAESFFDARRLGPAIPLGLLPAFDRMVRGAVQYGPLDVPCWGANTVRSEFAALTGIDGTALGLDRFNPYERFAQAPLRSLAWEMKRQGYRTICLHPFDKRFYARDRVMPHLGFDAFLGPEAFPPTPAGAYVTDDAIAHTIAALIAREGPRVFIFAMTMANHGPWTPGPAGSNLPTTLPERGALQTYLDGLRGTDAMIATLLDTIPPDGLLALYGDHQPSLPAAFAALGLTDPRTDYAIWHPAAAAAPAPTDIRAEDLATSLLRHHRHPAMDSAPAQLAHPVA